jgi:prepilin-type N-terminal cleavage/methylation domain-containing protein
MISQLHHQSRSAGRRRAGVSLIEIIVVIAIIGILASIGVARIAAPNARVFANDVKALLEEARYEAVRRNTPVAVTWNAVTSTFTTQAQLSTAFTFDTNTCSSGTVIRAHDASQYRGVTVSGSGAFTGAAAGIVWMPRGLVRTCTGADLPVTATTVIVTDPRGQRTLQIWPAGAVTGP